MEQRNKRIIVCMLLLLLPLISNAVVPGWLQQLRTLGGDPIAYDYTVQLVDSKGYVADSIRGSLYRNGKKYLDSNNTGLATSDGVFYCKLEGDRKTAIVYNIRALEHKMNVSMSDEQPVIAAFADSVIAKYGKLKTDSTPVSYVIRLEITPPQSPAIIVTLYLSRKDKQLERVVMDSPEPAEAGDTELWRKRYVMYRIRHQVPEGLFDQQRFYTISGTTVALKKIYAGYKLTSLIN